MGLPQRSNLSKYWQLDENTVFLNHGSFGASPIEVLKQQGDYREKIESDPVKFFERDYFEYYVFLGCVNILQQHFSCVRNFR